MAVTYPSLTGPMPSVHRSCVGQQPSGEPRSGGAGTDGVTDQGQLARGREFPGRVRP
jgi:hypothetical protein